MSVVVKLKLYMLCAGSVGLYWCCRLEKSIRKLILIVKHVIKGLNIKYVAPVDHVYTKIYQIIQKYIYALMHNARNQVQVNKIYYFRIILMVIFNRNKYSKELILEYRSFSNKLKIKIKNIVMFVKFVWINKQL